MACVGPEIRVDVVDDNLVSLTNSYHEGFGVWVGVKSLHMFLALGVCATSGLYFW